MLNHVHSQPDERDAFRLQPHSLFEPVFAAEQNLATCSDHALPWNSWNARMQSPSNLPRHARKTSRIRDITIGRDLAFGDAPDGCEEGAEVFCVRGFQARRL